MLEDVMDALDNLQQIHQELCLLGQEKHGVLIRGDVAALTSITAKEGVLVRQMGRTERSLYSSCTLWLESQGLQPEGITLLQLIEMVPRLSDQKRLKAAAQQLEQNLEKLAEWNRTNQMLLEQSLTYVNYMLTLVMQPEEQNVTYQRDEGLARKENLVPQRQWFDQKI